VADTRSKLSFGEQIGSALFYIRRELRHVR
jgi:hypothetical protein